MSRSLRLVTAGALVLSGLSHSALAQPAQNCGARDRVIELLASAYGETRRAIGLGADNRVVEVFASPQTGSWTITVTDPSGRTCLVASGQAYEAVAETIAPGKGA